MGYLGSMWEENVQTQNSATGHNRQPNASASLASMQACEQQWIFTAAVQSLAELSDNKLMYFHTFLVAPLCSSGTV